MNAVAYCHPFVPPEWIAAHGLRPCWLPCRAGDEPAVWVRRGVCPVAAARLDDFAGELPAEAVGVDHHLRSDPLRCRPPAASGRLPVFLLHVPRTWQTAAVRAFYREELSRLGRFLVALRRNRARRRRPFPDDAPIRSGESVAPPAACRDVGRRICTGDRRRPRPSRRDATAESVRPNSRTALGRSMPPASCLPLALVGGPMSPGDYELLTAVEDAGGRFVLDATESGERTLPAPVDMDRLKADPREELVRIYFDCIPDVFQRPNDRLFAWLREQIAQRCVRGILVRRHVWCDHWHGEMPRLREELCRACPGVGRRRQRSAGPGRRRRPDGSFLGDVAMNPVSWEKIAQRAPAHRDRE